MPWQHEGNVVGWESVIKTKAPWLPKYSKWNLRVLSFLLFKCWSLSEVHKNMNKKSHGAAEVTQELASHETCKCHNFPHTSEVSSHLTKPSKLIYEPSNTPSMLKTSVFNSTMLEAEHYSHTAQPQMSTCRMPRSSLEHIMPVHYTIGFFLKTKLKIT